MRTQDDWTRWGDAHPILSTVMQLGIYALIWLGVILALGLLGFVCAAIGKAGP